MSRKSESLDLGFARVERLAAEDAARVIEKASRIVSDFADRNAVPALDRVLAAAGGPASLEVAEETRLLADEVVERNRMLRTELARFMSLAGTR